MELSDITTTGTAEIINEFFDECTVSMQDNLSYILKISATDVPYIKKAEIFFDGTTQSLFDAFNSLANEYESDTYVIKQLKAGRRNVEKLLNEAVYTKTYLDGVCKELKKQLEEEIAQQSIKVLWVSRHDLKDDEAQAIGKEPKIFKQWKATVKPAIDAKLKDCIQNWADIVCEILPREIEAKVFTLCKEADVPMLKKQTLRNASTGEQQFIGWRQILQCEFESCVWRGIEAANVDENKVAV